MRFKRLDLNLLVVLDALLRERSVSRAAQHLNLSQPAVSSALGRLREYFNDDILVVHGKRMVPTAHAQTIEPQVIQALKDIEALISASTVFEPSTTQRLFRICASDHMSCVLLQPLIAELESAAPGLKIDITPSTPDSAARLERGEIDFLVTLEQHASREHPFRPLFEERHVVVGWKKNPVFRSVMTEEDFFAHGHVIVPPGSAPTFAEQQMAELNRRRRVELVCSSFLGAPWMLIDSLRLAVMQERLARMLAARLPLAIAPLPFPFPVMRELVQYHAAREADSGVQWLLRRMLDHAATLPGEPCLSE